MALYIPHSIFHLARLLYVRSETFGPHYVYSRCWIILRLRNVSHQSCRENQNTRFVLNNFLFRKIVMFIRYKTYCLLTPWSRVFLDETMWTNITVGPDTPHMTKRPIHFAFRIIKARIRKHTHTLIFITYCFSTASVVTWTRFDITLYVHCPSFSNIFRNLILLATSDDNQRNEPTQLRTFQRTRSWPL